MRSTIMQRDAPKFRSDLDVIPISYQGQQGVVIRDSLGINKNAVFIQGAGLMVLSLMDGRRSVKDIQLELIRQEQGSFVSLDWVNKVIQEFHAAFLLENEEYREKKDKIILDYQAESTREAAFAGEAYPSSPEELNTYLDSILNISRTEQDVELPKIKVLVAPHIDINTGRDVYAAAYRAGYGLSPKKILVLGVGHQLGDGFISLTEKDFVTPLGKVKTDKALVKRLKRMGKDVIAPHDITHRREHSIEFQLLFLQRLFGPDFLLVPVLCGSFGEVLDSVGRPGEIPGMKDFLSGLEDMLLEDPNTLIAAGVDFSHIGPKFGHGEKARSMLLETRAFDRMLMDAVCEGDIDKLWGLYRESGGKYNVCGFSVFSLLLELIPGIKGRVLGYDLWQEDATESAVSFAAMALY